MPKRLIPRQFNENLNKIKNNLKTEGILIWNNSHVAYLLNLDRLNYGILLSHLQAYLFQKILNLF